MIGRGGRGRLFRRRVRHGVDERAIGGAGLFEAGGVRVAVVEGAPGIEPGILAAGRHRPRRGGRDDVSDGRQVAGAELRTGEATR